MSKHICFGVGTHLSEAARMLIEAANEHGDADGDFNGVTLRADPNTTAEMVEQDFARQSEARHAAWLASPEGIAAEQRGKERRSAMQARHDALMSRLPALNWGDPYAVLDWVCEMQEASDHVGVIIRRDTIVSAFERRGYKVGDNCGDDYRPGHKDNMFRYLVGQALDGLKNGPAIHPIIHKFADEWRRQFPQPSPPPSTQGAR